MAELVFDLIIYHHELMFGPKMEYVGLHVMIIEGLDVDRLCFWDISNILKVYLGYKYKDLLILYYKYDEDNNENMHGLTKDQDIKMIKGLANGR
jgi:hypothetical protein